jgi:hypothetical protein
VQRTNLDPRSSQILACNRFPVEFPEHPENTANVDRQIPE